MNDSPDSGGLALYVIPVAGRLGAVPRTGYLGGAIATHLRAGSDALSLISPAIIGLLWGAVAAHRQPAQDHAATHMTRFMANT